MLLNGFVLAFVLYIIPAECSFVSRSEWGAKNPVSRIPKMNQTPGMVVIHHSTGNGCASKNDCIRRLKNIQIDHMKNRDFIDIAYNFLIDENGNVYEGRGWGNVGSHAKGYNSRSIGICFIGTYTDSAPNEKALKAAQNLIQEGVTAGNIKSYYELVGHRQTKATACPGTALFNTIKTWKNWSENVGTATCSK